MNSKQLFNDFAESIRTLGEDEARAISHLVFESLFGVSRTDILSARNIESFDMAKLEGIRMRLLDHEPVQYILGEAYFFNRRFKVTPGTLIPRPETEELVSQVIDYCRHKNSVKIVDVGTGSGCIAITLSLEIPKALVTGTDISDEALRTASTNASMLRASTQFLKHNILQENLPLTSVDVMVSNPPYIALAEKVNMSDNVVKFEPHLALFVDDSDPLIFYKALASQATTSLSTGGMLAVEINERFGNEVKNVFADAGLVSIKVIKDLNGKDRMVVAMKP